MTSSKTGCKDLCLKNAFQKMWWEFSHIFKKANLKDGAMNLFENFIGVSWSKCLPCQAVCKLIEPLTSVNQNIKYRHWFCLPGPACNERKTFSVVNVLKQVLIILCLHFSVFNHASIDIFQLILHRDLDLWTAFSKWSQNLLRTKTRISGLHCHRNWRKCFVRRNWKLPVKRTQMM